jgi:hypothetical protein
MSRRSHRPWGRHGYVYSLSLFLSHSLAEISSNIFPLGTYGVVTSLISRGVGAGVGVSWEPLQVRSDTCPEGLYRDVLASGKALAEISSNIFPLGTYGVVTSLISRVYPKVGVTVSTYPKIGVGAGVGVSWEPLQVRSDTCPEGLYRDVLASGI